MCPDIPDTCVGTSWALRPAAERLVDAPQMYLPRIGACTYMAVRGLADAVNCPPGASERWQLEHSTRSGPAWRVRA